jgi:hypothetical protein
MPKASVEQIKQLHVWFRGEGEHHSPFLRIRAPLLQSGSWDVSGQLALSNAQEGVSEGTELVPLHQCLQIQESCNNQGRAGHKRDNACHITHAASKHIFEVPNQVQHDTRTTRSCEIIILGAYLDADKFRRIIPDAVCTFSDAYFWTCMGK